MLASQRLDQPVLNHIIHMTGTIVAAGSVMMFVAEPLSLPGGVLREWLRQIRLGIEPT